MYSEKVHINYLTKLLLRLGITDIVVCPGARNAPLCHNFQEARFCLHPVTDERSAAFVALGIYLETKKPTAVCVTSGTAVLNTLPAIAEAFYRNIPLILISADRPEEWIGQLDGQTIPQREALSPYAPCINIKESFVESEIVKSIADGIKAQRPLHINIEIEEPLFVFNNPFLPDVEVPHFSELTTSHETEDAQLQTVAEAINNATFPLLVMGQQEEFAPALFEKLSNYVALHSEVISNAKHSKLSDTFEKSFAAGCFPNKTPDLVIHIGGAFVGKQMKLFLRMQQDLRVIRIGIEPEAPNTFGKVTHFVQASPITFLRQLLPLLRKRDSMKEWSIEAERCMSKIRQTAAITPATYPSLEETCICTFCETLEKHHIGALHAANSSSVRWLNAHIEGGKYPIFCNRGTNGIEGSLSTAAGHSLKSPHPVGCVIGDLSFFYDANALWNPQLRQNFIVLLLNNDGGKIFYKFEGLKKSPALKDYISAHHTTSAAGLCSSYHINHQKINSATDIPKAISEHLSSDTQRPLVLELHTAAENNSALR